MESENIYNFKRKVEKKPSEILLADCEFSIRAYQFLNGLGITNLEELSNFPEEEMVLKSRTINQKTMQEIKEVLVEHGLELKA